MDRPADTKCATPQMDWIGRPDLTQRIVDFLRANPYARAWAYHIDSDTACRTAKGTLDKMTKYVFDEDIEFGERYKEDAVKFQRRLRAQLGRLSKRYRKVVKEIGPLARPNARDSATGRQTSYLKSFNSTEPWWYALNKLWYPYYETKGTNFKNDRQILKKRKLDSDIEDFMVSDSESASGSDSPVRETAAKLRSASKSTSKRRVSSPTPSTPSDVLKTPQRKLPKSSTASTSALLQSPQIASASPTAMTEMTDSRSESSAIMEDIKAILSMNIRILELEAQERS